ncbi:hypothetical protein AAG589_15630 [Isoptericola sp. F-RaC21]|uniref:hypothetical protein n=1 Tax=Isoptericola sp. F-RaC21 TaxID=3141452 RepID=UPI00315BE99E
MQTSAESRRVDVRSVVITGLTTAAWYAVPDVVGPRWARALVKAGVLTGGLAIGVAATTEGRSAARGVREVRDELRDLRDADGGASSGARAEGTPPVGAPPVGERDDRERDDRERDDNVLAADGALDGADPLPGPAVAAVAAVGGLALGVSVAVVFEKWAYRRGERWRAQGRRLPHTRVGLILGVLAAAATALDPSASREPEGPEA